MLKKLFTLAASAIFTLTIFSQVPQKMSYQAVVRDADNKLVINQVVGMKISIIEGKETGEVVFVETQTPVSNANGLVTIEIGSGTEVSGNIFVSDSNFKFYRPVRQFSQGRRIGIQRWRKPGYLTGTVLGHQPQSNYCK
jgi:hypothetical protein